MLFCVVELYARAGGAGGSSSRSSYSGSKSYSSKSYGSGSRSSSYRSSSGMRNSFSSFKVGNSYNRNSFTTSNISQHTGYHSSHPFNNPIVWMLIINQMDNHKDKNTMTDEQFEAKANTMLLAQVNADFYDQYGTTVEHAKVQSNGVVVESKNKEYMGTYNVEVRKNKFQLTCTNVSERQRLIDEKKKKDHEEFIYVMKCIGSIFGILFLGLVGTMISNLYY